MNSTYDKTETPISTIMCLIGSSVLPFEAAFTLDLPPYRITARYAAQDEVQLIVNDTSKQIIDAQLSCTAAANLVRGLAEVSRRTARERKRKDRRD